MCVVRKVSLSFVVANCKRQKEKKFKSLKVQEEGSLHFKNFHLSEGMLALIRTRYQKLNLKFTLNDSIRKDS